MRGRHSAFYCRYLGEREADLKGPRALEAEAEIEVEYENVRAAWKWAADHGQEALLSQSAPGLGLYHYRRKLMREGVARFGQVREKVGQDEGVSLRTRALLLTWHSLLLYFTLGFASMSQAEQLARQALAHLDEAEDRGEEVRAERALAFLALGRSLWEEPRQSLQSLEASLALYGELGMRWEMVWVHGSLAGLYSRLGHYRRVREHRLQAQRLNELVGDARWSNYQKVFLGVNTVWSGKLEEAKEAEAAIREVLAWSLENDPWPNYAALAQIQLGGVLILSGQFREALSELMASLKEAGTSGRINAGRLRSWANLHMGRYQQAWQEGQSWLAASRETGYRYNEGFSQLVLGSAALALERLDAARGHLQESVATFEPVEQRDEMAWAQAGLGYVALHQGHVPTARANVADALHTASDRHFFWAALHALPAGALLLVELGDAERAEELYALASRYDFVANSQWFEDVAGRRIAEAVETLPTEEVAAAWARGGALDLWETVEELLQELREQEL